MSRNQTPGHIRHLCPQPNFPFICTNGLPIPDIEFHCNTRRLFTRKNSPTRNLIYQGRLNPSMQYPKKSLIIFRGLLMTGYIFSLICKLTFQSIGIGRRTTETIVSLQIRISIIHFTFFHTICHYRLVKITYFSQESFFRFNFSNSARITSKGISNNFIR